MIRRMLEFWPEIGFSGKNKSRNIEFKATWRKA